MKQCNLRTNSILNPLSLFNALSVLSILFVSMIIFSSCKNDSDMKNSTMKDGSMKDKSPDTMKKDMDKNMDNKNSIMHKTMNTMMAKMNAMKMTGNTDVDFVNMMIMHHQGAIEMANAEISSGKNDSIKSLARNIVKDQENEVASMRKWLEKNKDKKGTSGDNSMKLMESMKNMNDEDMKMTGDIDKDFIMMMIPHHEGAIDMAEVETKYGTDPEIKKMAEDIIVKQKVEIKIMEEWD